MTAESKIKRKKHLLYKYKPWCQYTKKILTDNEVWFTSPRDFNDPFDCAIEIDVSGGNRIKRQSRYERHLKDTRRDLTDHQIRELATLRANKPAYAEENEADYNQWLYDYRSDHFGILSLSWNRMDTLMWSHYAQFHRGICIAIKVESIDQAIVDYLSHPKFMIYRDDVKYKLLTCHRSQFKEQPHRNRYKKMLK